MIYSAFNATSRDKRFTRRAQARFRQQAFVRIDRIPRVRNFAVKSFMAGARNYTRNDSHIILFKSALAPRPSRLPGNAGLIHELLYKHPLLQPARSCLT